MISEKASLYNADNINVGVNSRIDDFCVLSAGEGGIEIGRNVHIAVYCSLIGSGKIILEDFSGLSSRVAIYSSNDDYSGNYLTNPTVPPEFTNVTHAPVTVCRHAIIGAGSIILPGVTIGEGAAVGAMSLVTKDVPPYTVVSGVPAKKIKTRKKGFIEMEQRYLDYLKD